MDQEVFILPSQISHLCVVINDHRRMILVEYLSLAHSHSHSHSPLLVLTMSSVYFILDNYETITSMKNSLQSIRFLTSDIFMVHITFTICIQYSIFQY